MDYSILIQDFVDGALEQGKEEELFHALSGNEELRFELKNELAIKDSIRNDSKAFTPAVESTKRIFAAVGFNPPPAAVNLPAPVPSTGIMQILSKFKQGLIGSIVGAGITAAVLLMLTPDNTQNVNINGSGGTTTQNMSQSAEPENAIPYTKSYETTVKPQIITKTVYKPVYVYLPADNKQESNNNANPVQNDDIQVKKDILLSHSPLYSSNSFGNCHNNVSNNNMNDINSIFSIPKLVNEYTNNVYSNPIGISLVVSGSQNWFAHNPTINPRQTARLNNNSLGIFYDLSDALSLGMEIRQENFFQIFEGNDSIGNRYRYEQQPNFTSYGLSLRYRLLNIFDEFFPTLQVNLGGNRAGFVGRGALGLEYSPFSSLSFLINGEYSSLRFKHQGTNYWSPKFGLNYGISLKF